jgi:AcrR family transcriptional regulator
MRIRKHKKIRKEMILCTAIEMSLKVGYQHLIRDKVAKKAGISGALVNKYFGTIETLKKEVLRVAIEKGIIEIVAQGLGMRDPDALKAPEEIKQKAFSFMKT